MLAGIDLLTGKVDALVKDRHRSHKFIEFLELLDTPIGPYGNQVDFRQSFRPLGFADQRPDSTFGEATPCIKNCVLVEGQADRAVAALTPGQGIARVGAMRLIAIADRIADAPQSR